MGAVGTTSTRSVVFIMQLAINVVIFVLGFSLASWFALKPQKQKKDLESLARDVHGQGNGRQKLSSQHDVLLKSESETGSNLLTMYVHTF